MTMYVYNHCDDVRAKTDGKQKIKKEAETL